MVDFFAAAHSFKSFMLNLAHWIHTALEKQAGHGYHDAPIWLYDLSFAQAAIHPELVQRVLCYQDCHLEGRPCGRGKQVELMLNS